MTTIRKRMGWMVRFRGVGGKGQLISMPTKRSFNRDLMSRELTLLVWCSRCLSGTGLMAEGGETS